MRLTIPLLLVVLVSSTTASSTDESDNLCAPILEHGIYNYFSENVTSSEASSAMSQLCTSSSQLHKGQTSVGGGVGWGVLTASFHFSQAEVNAMSQLLCQKNSSSQSTHNSLATLSHVIDPEILTAYQACLNETGVATESHTGLQIDANLTPDQSQVTIQVTYTPVLGGATTVIIEGIEISPVDSWQCEGPLWSEADNGELSGDMDGMFCTRNISSTPTAFESQQVYAGSSSIIIFTNVGTVTKSFSPIIAN